MVNINEGEGVRPKTGLLAQLFPLVGMTSCCHRSLRASELQDSTELVESI